MPRAAPRSLAYSSSSQTAASAYRLAVVMNSQRSEASRNWWAKSRCADTTESMSGVSSRATPLGMPSLAASTRSPSRPDRASPSWRTRGTVGRNTFSANQSASSGWQASTGLFVVGRRIPVALTWAPDDAVDQRRLARAGRAHQRDQDGGLGLADPGQEIVVDLAEQLAPLRPGGFRALGLIDQVHVHDPAPEREQGRLELPGIDPAMPPPLRRPPELRVRAAAGPEPGGAAGGGPGRTGSTAGAASAPVARADAAARPCPSVIALLSLPFVRRDDSGRPG